MIHYKIYPPDSLYKSLTLYVMIKESDWDNLLTEGFELPMVTKNGGIYNEETLDD